MALLKPSGPSHWRVPDRPWIGHTWYRETPVSKTAIRLMGVIFSSSMVPHVQLLRSIHTARSTRCVLRLHWENYISISFHIKWEMIVVIVFLSILNQMEFHLIQNWKENCHHDYIPFNLKGNGILVFSVYRNECRCKLFNYSGITS